MAQFIVQMKQRDKWIDTHWTNPVERADSHMPVLPVSKTAAVSKMKHAAKLYPTELYRIQER